MNITKLQQEIKTAEESLARMKEQLEEAKRMNDKDFYPGNERCKFDPEDTLRVVDGDYMALGNSFYWDLTPQGYDYWHQKRYEEFPITDEDKITLLRWVVNYYQSKENHGT